MAARSNMAIYLNIVKSQRKNIALLNPSCSHPGDERIHCETEELIFINPGEHLGGDQECRDSMDSAPQGLADEFRVTSAQLTRGDAIEDAAAERIEGLHARRVRLDVLDLDVTFRVEGHENDAIMLGIFEAELDVGPQASLQAFEWISGLLENTIEMLDQSRKGFLANLIEQVSFVFEI